MKYLGRGIFMSAALAGFHTAAMAGPDIGTLATPPGITLEPLGTAQGYEFTKVTASRLPRDDLAFADAQGMTLYTSDADPVGKSLCVDDCAREWRPAPAPPHVKGFGEWSVISRKDGGSQWAYRGKPLYTSVWDVDPGSVYGNSPARFGPTRKNRAGKDVGGCRAGLPCAVGTPLPAGWHTALLFPVSGITLPAEITVKEVQDAAGLVLVDHNAMTLYAFAGDARKNAQGHNGPWRPAAASQLSDPVGDFGLIDRDDGIRQWTYKGKGLYTFAGDITAEDANGIGADKHYVVAALYRYYMPPSITVQNTLAQGKVLATAAGLTLYRRDAHIEQTGGGHGFRHGQPMRPAVGREIGIAHVDCDGNCSKVWHPYAAPADAQAWGQWTVATWPGGQRQWVYQGFPLWTYDGDKKPGEINGNDSYDLIFAGAPASRRNPNQAIDIGTPQDGAAALYWWIAVP